MNLEWATQQVRLLANLVEGRNNVALSDSSFWSFSRSYQAARTRVHAQLPIAVRIAKEMGELELAESLASSADGKFGQTDLVGPASQLLTLLEG